jgi:hypothetical protein
VSQRLSTAETRRYERGLIEDEKYGEREMRVNEGRGRVTPTTLFPFATTRLSLMLFGHTHSLSLNAPGAEADRSQDDSRATQCRFLGLGQRECQLACSPAEEGPEGESALGRRYFCKRVSTFLRTGATTCRRPVDAPEIDLDGNGWAPRAGQSAAQGTQRIPRRALGSAPAEPNQGRH